MVTGMDSSVQCNRSACYFVDACVRSLFVSACIEGGNWHINGYRFKLDNFRHQSGNGHNGS